MYQQTTKTLMRLRGSAGFETEAYARKYISHDAPKSYITLQYRNKFKRDCLVRQKSF